jgi:hypothetical protein
MTQTIDNLLKNSRLPGPRGNLELLFSFSKTATEDEVNECLSYCVPDVRNSPEEFVAMCGIVGYCVLHKNSIGTTLAFVRKYASQCSWRVREAVAIGIQQIAERNMNEIIDTLKNWTGGNDLEKRAVVAALCEPKLLKEKGIVVELFGILDKLTMEFDRIAGKLSDNQDTLRKTLGYGWSVAIVSLPDKGKTAFEKIAKHDNKHIKWIVKENLKKNRLITMDKAWVEHTIARFVS